MSTATAISALIPALTVRQVLDVATRLADLMDERGIEYSNVTASGGESTEYVTVHPASVIASIGPRGIIHMLGLPVASVEDYTRQDHQFSVGNTELEGVCVKVFGAYIAPTCGAVDEDDQGRRVCGLSKGHAIASAHRFATVAS